MKSTGQASKLETQLQVEILVFRQNFFFFGKSVIGIKAFNWLLGPSTLLKGKLLYSKSTDWIYGKYPLSNTKIKFDYIMAYRSLGKRIHKSNQYREGIIQVSEHQKLESQ